MSPMAVFLTSDKNPVQSEIAGWISISKTPNLVFSFFVLVSDTWSGSEVNDEVWWDQGWKFCRLYWGAGRCLLRASESENSRATGGGLKYNIIKFINLNIISSKVNYIFIKSEIWFRTWSRVCDEQEGFLPWPFHPCSSHGSRGDPLNLTILKFHYWF